MGYSLDSQGRLCCDYCGHSGGVVKVRCPFGYCPAPAVCPTCRKTHAADFTVATHRERGCERNHLRLQARMAEAARMIQEGRLLRKAASTVPSGVKVLFEGQTERLCYIMAPETYDAIPLLVNATPEDYQRFGSLTKAANCNLWDGA